MTLKRALTQARTILLSSSILLVSACTNASNAGQNQLGGLSVRPLDTQQTAAQQTPARQTSAQLQQIVAPIALYPDALVAQILAAATYSAQVVEADRWMQQHPGLTGKQLAAQVDKQPWDPSVKALTEFPTVLANMDKNLSWTSSLGNAYVSQTQDVMNAVQVMRHRAQSAGNLTSTTKEKATAQGRTIVIQPPDPNVVYVPEYDPWIVYGAPVVVWPGWYPYPGLYAAAPGIAFGAGIQLGFFGSFGWGWHHWGADWAHRSVTFNHRTFVSHSTTVINRHTVINHNHFANHGASFHHNVYAHGARSFGGSHGGGEERRFAAREQSSFHGGFHGDFHGGFHSGARR